MTAVSSTSPDASCPYSCGARCTLPVRSRHCPQCRGNFHNCALSDCGTPNRVFARFCRRCRQPLSPWESWTCGGGVPAGSGRIRLPSPFVDLLGFRLAPTWPATGVTLGSEVGPDCAVASFGALATFTHTGLLSLI